MPWQSASPPPGSYDPTIDANYNAAYRGYTDLQDQTAEDNRRAGLDVGLAVGADEQSGVGQRKAWSLSDNMRDRTRAAEDHGTATANLGRQYGNLARSQGQQAQQAGAVGGGALADALLKRTANQGREQTGLDTSLARTLGSLGESDRRIIKSAQDQVQQIGQRYDYGVADRNLAAGDLRAGREFRQFGIDSEKQRSFQASSNGLYQAPVRPANEFKSAGGTSYRVLKGKTTRFMLPNGQIVSTRPR